MLRSKWLENSGIQKITDNTKLCSEHFLESDFIYSGTKMRLKADAIPVKIFRKPTDFTGLNVVFESRPENATGNEYKNVLILV